MNKLLKGLSYWKMQKGKLHAKRLSSTGDILAMQTQCSVGKDCVLSRGLSTLSRGKGFFLKSYVYSYIVI